MLKNISLFLLAAIALFLSSPINSDLHTRDLALISINDFLSYQPQYKAEDFCINNLKENYRKIHCDTINPDYVGTLEQGQKEKVKNEIQLALDANVRFLESLKAKKLSNDQYIDLTLIADKKIEKLKEIIGNLNNDKLEKTNADLFEYLLIAQGKTYNEFSNTFKEPPQSISRFIMNPNNIQNKLKRLRYISAHFYLYSFFIILGIFLLLRKISVTGKLLALSYLVLNLIGLNIVRDASLHFGFESNLFSLNPFSGIFERQILIFGSSIILFLLCASKADLFGALFEKISRKLTLGKIALLSSITTIVFYFLFGPSLGSETFKISTCLIAALVLSQHGRVVELAQEQFGINTILKKSLQFRSYRKSDQNNQLLTTYLSDYFSYYLANKVLLQIFLVGFLIIFVGALFSDLGGSLIAASIFTFSLFVLLGNRFALSILILLVSIIYFLFLASEKFRGRVQLMFEPMHANISDFARLIQFQNGAGAYGYHFNQIKWCSNDGVCLPLQSLSDYMPTLLNGVLGSTLGFIFFVLFSLFLLYLAQKAFKLAWFYSDKFRFLKIFSSLLCVSSFIQLLVTVFGNWRLIPLTGLGTPLISIGLSSSIAATIGISLVIGLCFKNLK